MTRRLSHFYDPDNLTFLLYTGMSPIAGIQLINELIL